MRHLLTHQTMASTIPLRNRPDHTIPLNKSLPWLPRAARVKRRLCTTIPVSRPPCQGPLAHTPCAPPSPSSWVLQVTWHFRPPTSHACFHPGLAAGTSVCFKCVAPWDLWISACISNQMPVLHKAFLKYPEYGHATMPSYIILLMGAVSAWKYLSGIYHLSFFLIQWFSTEGDFAPSPHPGDIWQCLKTFLVVILGKRC